jgi:hypothetical protein
VRVVLTNCPRAFVLLTPSGRHEMSGLNPDISFQRLSSAGSLNFLHVLARAASVACLPGPLWSLWILNIICSIISVGKRHTCMTREVERSLRLNQSLSSLQLVHAISTCVVTVLM